MSLIFCSSASIIIIIVIVIVVVVVIVIIFITRLVSAAFGAGRFLDGGGPLHRAGQGWRWCYVFHIVEEAKLIEALWRLFALRLVAGALSLRAVSVAQTPHRRRLVPLDPCVVVADDVLMIEAREQGHLPFDSPELLTGWVDLDALHSIIAAVQFVLNLEAQRRERESNKWGSREITSLSVKL